jgi:rhodanese-related sulfurtransferase
MTIRKLLFILPLGFSLTAMSCSTNTDQLETQQEKEVIVIAVNVTEFAELLKKDEGQLLDVRTPEEWALGSIKGASKINFLEANFSEQLNKLDKTKPVYVYCKSGGRSGKAAKQLEKKGFTVYNLIGGISAWKAAGKTIVK